MINSRSIEQLLPQVRSKVQEMLSIAKGEGIELILTSTYRDFESQAALYAIGRTTPGASPRMLKPLGDRVTNAKAGQSWHNWRRAVDVVPVVGGKAIWNDAKTWARIGQIGERVGLEWAGRWVGFREMPHFQLTEGRRLADLVAQYPHGLPEIGGEA